MYLATALAASSTNSGVVTVPAPTSICPWYLAPISAMALAVTGKESGFF